MHSQLGFVTETKWLRHMLSLKNVPDHINFIQNSYQIAHTWFFSLFESKRDIRERDIECYIKITQIKPHVPKSVSLLLKLLGSLFSDDLRYHSFENLDFLSPKLFRHTWQGKEQW